MRVKCLAQENSGYAVPQPGLKPGQLDSKSSAVIIRPPASCIPQNSAFFSDLLSCQIDLWNNLFAFISARWPSRTCKSATYPFTPVYTTIKKEVFLSRLYIIFLDLCTPSSTHSTTVWLDTSEHASFLMECMCMLVYLVSVCALPLLYGLHLFGVDFHIHISC